MIIDPHIPKLVQPIIKNYIQQTERYVPGLINAFHIVGSIAMDEFNERFSDIDFLSILNRKGTPAEIEHLRNIHQTSEDSFRWKLSGSYLQPGDLGKLGDDLQPHPHFHDGVLYPAARNGLNSVTWWELKNHSIPILGGEARSLPFEVNWDLLIAEMRENLNSYWLNWTRHPLRIVLMYSDWGIQWSVLGVLRQFYTFRENSITTKVRAATYALEYLPTQWHLLVQEAINIRQGSNASFYGFKFGRMVEAVRFLKYIIKTCGESLA